MQLLFVQKGGRKKSREPTKPPDDMISEDDRIYTWYIDENVKSVSCILIGFQLDHFVLQLDNFLLRGCCQQQVRD